MNDTNLNNLQTIAKESAILLDENKATELKVYDVNNVCNYANYVLLANGSSITHLKTLAEKLAHLYKKNDISPYVSQKNFQKNEWMLLDYGDIIIHLTLKETRAYYQLDELFQKAKVIGT